MPDQPAFFYEYAILKGCYSVFSLNYWNNGSGMPHCMNSV